MEQEIRMLSRGGQGAVTAAKLLVAAAVRQNLHAQMVPNFGQERKGALVSTFARVSPGPILSHTYVYTPHLVVLFDPSVVDLGVDPLEGIHPGATLLVNLGKPLSTLPWAAGFARVGVIDATGVTRELVGTAPPNAAMLGALARATGLVDIDSVAEVILAGMPGSKGEKNAACARAAYERTVVHEQ